MMKYIVVVSLLALVARLEPNSCCLSASSLITGDASPITALAYSPDGAYLAASSVTAGTTARVAIYQVNGDTLQYLASYDLPSISIDAFPKALAFSPDGSLLATANLYSNDVVVFAVQDGVLSDGASYPLSNYAQGTPQSLAFTPDGLWLFVDSGPAASMTVFYVYFGTLRNGAASAYGNGNVLVVSPNGAYLVTIPLAYDTSSHNGVNQFQILNGVLSPSTDCFLPASSSGPDALAYCHDGSCLTTANANSNDVTVFSAKNGSLLCQGTSYSLPSNSTAPSSVALSPADDCLITANGNSNDVTLFNVVDGVLNNGTSYKLPWFVMKGTILNVAFSPNGTQVAVGNNFIAGVALFSTTCTQTMQTQSPH